MTRNIDALEFSTSWNVCLKDFVGSVVLLAKGLGEEHEPVTRSRMTDQWRHSRRKYLTWVREREIREKS